MAQSDFQQLTDDALRAFIEARSADLKGMTVFSIQDGFYDPAAMAIFSECIEASLELQRRANARKGEPPETT